MNEAERDAYLDSAPDLIMGRPMYYMLEGREVRPAKTRREAFEQMRDHEARRVAETQVGPLWVSTVFMNLDHSFQSGPLLVFETMVFDGGSWDSWGDMERRYSTYEDAERGHAEVVAFVRAHLDKQDAVLDAIDPEPEQDS